MKWGRASSLGRRLLPNREVMKTLRERECNASIMSRPVMSICNVCRVYDELMCLCKVKRKIEEEGRKLSGLLTLPQTNCKVSFKRGQAGLL
jgi:hypothetical protein